MNNTESKITAKFIQQLMHNDTSNIFNSDTLKSLNIEYNEKLVEHNYGFSRKELKTKDIINLISVCKYNESTDSYIPKNTAMPIVHHTDIDKEYYKTYNWLSYIPCFQEGVYRTNIGRYVYFKIQNINIDEKSVTIFIQDYTYNNGIWHIGVSGTVTYKCNPMATFDDYIPTNMITTMTNITLFHDLYTKISYKELQWSKNQINLWENTIIKNSDIVVNELQQQNTDNFKELTKYFQHFTILSNQLLYQHKPKAIRETKEQKLKRQRKIINAEETPRKITRTVGPIKMTSTKIPKYPTNETIIHYKTAVWKCRGGVRRLKSGKLVPFKESIHHRRCLTNDTNTPQIEIKFTK